MPLKRNLTYNKLFQKPGSGQVTIEKSLKSKLRKLPKADLKFSSKFLRVEDPRIWQGETEAHNVKMYKTHFPGFCYLRDGNYRSKVTNAYEKPADASDSSEKIKALLFTNNEIDIKKVICLHLLGTQTQNLKNIRRKDDQLCTFIRSTQSNKYSTFQSQRLGSCEKEASSMYDKMLPRYVLEICFIGRNSSSLSLNLSDHVNYSDDDLGRRRNFQIPLYINNDVREIVNSVLEALETVNSPKFAQVIALAQSPEHLKDLLSNEEIQEFMIELSGNQLINNSKAYDLVMATSTFDNVPDGGKAEVVAQILEIAQDWGLRNILHILRKTITASYEEYVFWNMLPGKMKRIQSTRKSTFSEASRTSFTSECERNAESDSSKTKCQINQNTQRKSPVEKTNSHSPRSLLDQVKLHSEFGSLQDEESSAIIGNDSKNLIDSKFHDCELNRIDLKNLNNSQRIILGLNVAKMKCKPINMHQFENKKEIDIPSLISSIIRQTVFDSAADDPSTEENFYGLEKRKTKKSMSVINNFQIQGLGIITRDILSNFRYDVAATENKKRVKDFIQEQL